jgi:hypothetical protein
MCRGILFHDFPLDVPPNTNIAAFGPGAGFENHPADVVLLLKRNASDNDLCQAKNQVIQVIPVFVFL